jgi:hypothetical protein
MHGLCLSLLSFTILCSCLLIIIVAHVFECVNRAANYTDGQYCSLRFFLLQELSKKRIYLLQGLGAYGVITFNGVYASLPLCAVVLVLQHEIYCSF